MSDEDTPITEKQRYFLIELIFQRVQDKRERERWLSQVDGVSKVDASEMIQGFLMAPVR